MTGNNIKVTYLLAVWGEQYIRQFMELSLRSLLAPGNIPGLAEHTESTFVFLTRKVDRKAFAEHPMFRRLETYCRVEFVIIDDLIFGGNYSATLTLAYERGMRHAGKEMLSTYFIYLVADYVMADGSLANILPYMQRGVSGITAGNFQVVEEDLLESFKARMHKATGVLSLPPRELMALTLPHLHPLTVANIVNQDFSHTEHTNRLFWRVDAETLVGRFYLRHMLCIKPEINNYIIGASCDYSYIAEMCPSGNVVHIADSDEYCVIELQPFAHEKMFIKHGPFAPQSMIRSLGQWVTRAHRDNAFTPVVYHSKEISAAAKKMIEESRKFVERVEKRLPEKPQRLRGHPYWVSCIEGVLEMLVALNNQADYFRRGVFAGIVGSPVFEPPLGTVSGDYNLLKITRYRYGSDWRARALKLVRAVSGNEAQCKFWHREYAHARAINRVIRKAAAGTSPFLFIAYEPTGYAEWCHGEFGERVSLQKYELFDSRAVEIVKAQAPGASHAVILLPVAYVHLLGEALAKCAACLTGERKVTVIVTQRYFSRGDQSFKEKLAMLAAIFDGSGTAVESFISITGVLRPWLDDFYQQQTNIIMQPSLSPRALLRRFLPTVRLMIANMGYVLGNLLSRQRPYPRLGNATCAIIELKLTGHSNMVLHCERKLREETYE